MSQQILLFWLAKGVDGFRVDSAAFLFEDEQLTNETKSGIGITGDFESLIHDYTQFQPETFEILTEWRSLLDGLSKDDGKDR